MMAANRKIRKNPGIVLKSHLQRKIDGICRTVRIDLSMDL